MTSNSQLESPLLFSLLSAHLFDRLGHHPSVHTRQSITQPVRKSQCALDETAQKRRRQDCKVEIDTKTAAASSIYKYTNHGQAGEAATFCRPKIPARGDSLADSPLPRRCVRALRCAQTLLAIRCILCIWPVLPAPFARYQRLPTISRLIITYETRRRRVIYARNSDLGAILS